LINVPVYSDVSPVKGDQSQVYKNNLVVSFYGNYEQQEVQLRMWDGILIDRDRSSGRLWNISTHRRLGERQINATSILLFGKRNSAFQPCCTMRPNPAPDSGTTLQRRTLHVGTAWSLDCAGLPSRNGIACSAFSVEPRLWSASCTQRRHVSTFSSLCKGWDCGSCFWITSTS
jgi:hypothetical protein